MALRHFTERDINRRLVTLDENMYELVDEQDGHTKWLIVYYPPMGCRGYWRVGRFRLDFEVDSWTASSRANMLTSLTADINQLHA